MYATNRVLSIMLIFGAVSATAAFQVHGTRQQASPCRAASPVSDMALYGFKQMWVLNDADSASVALVADSTTCQAVVDAYNAQSAPAMHVESAYVFRTDTGFILYLPPQAGTPYTTEVGVIFGADLRIQVRMASPR